MYPWWREVIKFLFPKYGVAIFWRPLFVNLGPPFRRKCYLHPFIKTYFLTRFWLTLYINNSCNWINSFKFEFILHQALNILKKNYYFSKATLQIKRKHGFLHHKMQYQKKSTGHLQSNRQHYQYPTPPERYICNFTKYPSFPSFICPRMPNNIIRRNRVFLMDRMGSNHHPPIWANFILFGPVRFDYRKLSFKIFF